MFNQYQREYMRELSELQSEEKCKCGWYRKGQCPNCKPEDGGLVKLKHLLPSVPSDGIGIPNVPAMVHQAERFDEKAKQWAEETLPRILELADSACGGTDEQLISELAQALKNFAESEIAWRNAGK